MLYLLSARLSRILHFFHWRVALIFCIVIIGVRAQAQDVARRTLRGHLPPPVATEPPTGRFPETNRMHLAIGLPVRNQAALSEFLRELYDPASTNYHQYLTPAEFTARFGPTDQDYQAVRKFAETNDFKVTRTIGSRLVLDVEGSVANVERAFQVTLRTYRHPTENRDFVSPDREPSVPATLSVADIGGLSDFSRPHPLLHHRSASPQPLAGTAPGGDYWGSNFRNAYVPGTTLNGTGQTVGLLEFDGYNGRDITNYENDFGATVGLTNRVALTNVLLDFYGGGAGSGNDEVCLDIEMCVSMAPKLSQIIVYEGNPANGFFNPADVVSQMANDNLAKQLSSSWTWSGGPETTIDNSFMQMAAQGQSYYQAAGDNDAYTGSQPLDDPGQVNSPVGSTNITVVGGTGLTTISNANNAVTYSNEVVWNWNSLGGSDANTGSSGGVSTYYAIPWWQTNVNMSFNNGSTTMRNVPDVALTADNVFVVYSTSGHHGGSSTSGTFGGTSCAAPLWAAFTALVNQQSALFGGKSVGFANPAIYRIAESPNYTNCFHDITISNNIGTGTPGLYYATNGYDLCTGWGTPNGTNLINALAACIFILQPPASATVTNGNTVTLSITMGGQSPFGYQWLLNGTNLVANASVSGTTSNVLSFTPITTNYAGNYKVIVTNSFGSVTSGVATLTVVSGSTPPPVAAFSGSPTNGLVPLTVNFANTSTGATNYSWSFGDGQTNSSTNPAHTYTNAGSYTVTLTAIGAGGTNTLGRTNYIVVTNPPPPVASFTGSPTSGSAPLTVNFANTSTGATNYNWNFGDGGSSAATNPAHTYTNAGTYTVTLTAVGAGGTNSLIRPNYIVATNPPPSVAFVASPTNGVAPLTVYFTNQASGATNYSWNFGDGQTNGSANPVHTYTNAGSYSVSLTAFGPGGQASLVRSNYVAATNPPPVANFSGSPTSGPVPLTVNFTNTSTNATNYNWSFGDGNSSALTNPAHTYTNVGTYTVTLTAVGAGGTNILTLPNYIGVTNPPPSVAFVASPTNGVVPLTVYFTNFSSGATNYSWSFGDGQTNTAVNPTNTYANAGSYNVSLTAFGPGGQTSLVFSNYIIVTNPPPVAGFSGSPTNGPAPLTVNFANTTTGATNYNWNFGDGNISTAANPGNTYTNAGTYTVTLTAVGAAGTNSLILPNYITVTNLPPSVAFVASSTNGGAPLTVYFTNLSIGATNYSWDFGDGQTNGNANPTNTYNSQGSYTVTLTAFGPGGQAALVVSNYIVLSNSPPVLTPIADQVVHPGMTVVITNSATDPDSAQSLAYSLDPGAPPLASVDPVTGLFNWTPDSSYANTTNGITVRVTDNGVPPLSDAQSFNVTVLPLVFQPVVLSNGILTISWGSISGVTYRVEYITNLAGTNWTALPPDVTATSDTSSTTDATQPDAQRFYRILVLP